MAGFKNSTHHRSHAHPFLSTLTMSQKNSLRLLLVKDAAAEVHHLLDVKRSVTRVVHDVGHKLALARAGRTAELFAENAATHIKITL